MKNCEREKENEKFFICNFWAFIYPTLYTKHHFLTLDILKETNVYMDEILRLHVSIYLHFFVRFKSETPSSPILEIYLLPLHYLFFFILIFIWILIAFWCKIIFTAIFPSNFIAFRALFICCCCSIYLFSIGEKMKISILQM